MRANEILSQSRDAMSARRVFGEPIERGGVTVVPVMRLLGGAGGGGGEENASLGGDAGGTQDGSSPDGPAGGLHGEAASFGVGFGVKATPAGVYVIKGDDVRWLPAVDPERLAIIGGLIGVTVLLVLRSILRSALRR